MSIKIRVNGEVYENFKEATLYSSLKTISGSYTILSTADENDLLPIKVTDSVEILVDDVAALTGFVDSLSGSHSKDTHSITINGRDKTADIIDSTVGSKKEYKGSLSLKKLIENILSNSGISGIKVIDEIGTLEQFTSSDLISAEIGQSIFDFIDTYASKKQALLTTDGLGNVVITRGSTISSGVTLVKLKNDKSRRNNVISSSINIDNSNRFNKYIVQTQSNPLFAVSSSNTEDDTNINASAVDSEVRASRVLEFQAEETLDSKESKKRAEWEANLRRSNSFKYTATVQGHSHSNDIWRPNRLVAVIDEFWDISSNGLLITDVEYTFSTGGSKTKLTMVYPESYTVQAELDASIAAKQDLGGLFKL